MRAEKGLTLIELMAVLTIVSILLGVGLPSLENLVRESANSAASFEFIAQVNWARTQAATLGQRVALCRCGNTGAAFPQCDTGPSTDPAHDGYEDGWLLFTDPNHHWQPDQPANILRRYEGMPTGSVTIRGQARGNNPDHIGFTSLGLSAGTTGSIVVCDGRGWAQNGHYAHVIIMSPDGRIRDVPGDSSGLSVSSCTP